MRASNNAPQITFSDLRAPTFSLLSFVRLQRRGVVPGAGVRVNSDANETNWLVLLIRLD